MTASLDKALAPLADHVRAIDDYPTRFEAIEAAEQRFRALKRALLQETALGLRAEGKKWKEVGTIMGGVSFQRAFQIAHGE